MVPSILCQSQICHISFNTETNMQSRYEHSSEPRSVGFKRSKYREQKQAYVEDALWRFNRWWFWQWSLIHRDLPPSQNIMFDRRVVRGSTYGKHHHQNVRLSPLGVESSVIQIILNVWYSAIQKRNAIFRNDIFRNDIFRYSQHALFMKKFDRACIFKRRWYIKILNDIQKAMKYNHSQAPILANVQYCENISTKTQPRF